MAYKDKEKQREYQRNWARKNNSVERTKQRRKELRQKVCEWKLKCGCSKCGYNKCANALDIHHPGGKGKDGKDTCISALCGRGFAWPKILKILEDCEVICANCHRELHFQESTVI